MKHNKPCGCGKPVTNCGVSEYVDLTRLETKPWSDARAFYGIDNCEKFKLFEKPEFELTEEDVEKLDKIIIDGDGDKFLADDGNYYTIDADSLDYITLVYDENPVNFVLANQEKINKIKELALDGKETFVNILYNQYVLPVTVGWTASLSQLMFEYDAVNYPLNTRVSYQRLRILIVLGVETSIPEVRVYEVTNPSDADYIIDVTGDGSSALYNDGTYKPTYTVQQVNDKIDLELEDYYNKDEVNELVGESLENVVVYDPTESGIVTPINARGDIVLENNRKLFGKNTGGGVYKIAEVSQWNIVDLGSAGLPLTLSSSERPVVQLTGETGAEAHPIAYLSEIEDVKNNLLSLDAEVEANYNELQEVRTSTENALNSLNGDLQTLTDRVDDIEDQVEINTIDIAGIREDITNAEHFRGYFETTSEITSLPNPTNGDYAWNAETGTVWTYNGITWANSGDPIPDQTVIASDQIPLVADGTGNAGTSTEYARGDHRHPEDTTKANRSELSNYLALAGNSQTTTMTGDIWLGSSNQINLSDTGNSYIGVNQTLGGVELVAGGSNGIDLISSSGTVKANGQRVIVNGENTPSIQLTVPLNAAIQFNVPSTGGAVGLSLVAGSYNVSGNAAIYNLTGTAGFNVNTTSGNIVLNPTVNKLFYGSADIALNEVARLSDIESLNASIANQYLALSGGALTGLTTYMGYELATLNDISEISGDYVATTGDTMTGGLIMQASNITLDADQSIRFNGDGSTRIGYVADDLQLEIIASTTANGVNVVTNPSNANSIFKYNGVEVATVNNLADLVSDSDLTTILADYVTQVSLNSQLGNYYTSTQIDGILTGYSTTTEIIRILADYVTQPNLNTTLNDYLTRSDYQTYITDYYTKTEVDSVIDSIQDSIDSIEDGYVTLDTDQTITGIKTINSATVNGVSLTTLGADNQFLAADGQYKLVEIPAGVFSFETTITADNEFTLPTEPEEILLVQFERVQLFSDEYTLSGDVITLTAADLDYTGTNRIKVLYK